MRVRACGRVSVAQSAGPRAVGAAYLVVSIVCGGA